uniref:NADH-ubiquinone oxidoreductase chain 6 n=1 Tax=Haliplus lineatocollis TaxID=107853 RepID=A0A191ZRD0_9COLE|nr:NADH dehydrogenase subunit 6 [Haliplus lineatocollis]
MFCIMYMYLMMMNISMSMIFLFMNHPMSMGLILMIQTLIISLMTGMLSFSFWFSYILFLVMIGGMLILFIYMTSMASNEMFKFSINNMILLLMMIIIMMITYLFMDYLFMMPMLKNSNLYEMINNMMMMNNENLITLNKIYNMPNNLMTILLINYLLLTLIATVKITNIKQGPLRQKF